MFITHYEALYSTRSSILDLRILFSSRSLDSSSYSSYLPRSVPQHSAPGPRSSFLSIFIFKCPTSEFILARHMITESIWHEALTRCSTFTSWRSSSLLAPFYGLAFGLLFSPRHHKCCCAALAHLSNDLISLALVKRDVSNISYLLRL